MRRDYGDYWETSSSAWPSAIQRARPGWGGGAYEFMRRVLQTAATRTRSFPTTSTSSATQRSCPLSGVDPGELLARSALAKFGL